MLVQGKALSGDVDSDELRQTRERRGRYGHSGTAKDAIREGQDDSGGAFGLLSCLLGDFFF